MCSKLVVPGIRKSFLFIGSENSFTFVRGVSTCQPASYDTDLKKSNRRISSPNFEGLVVRNSAVINGILIAMSTMVNYPFDSHCWGQISQFRSEAKRQCRTMVKSYYGLRSGMPLRDGLRNTLRQCLFELFRIRMKEISTRIISVDVPESKGWEWWNYQIPFWY
jgi:hypothetical protein